MSVITSQEERNERLAFVALICVVVLPLFFCTMPPLVDLPNHIARIHILANSSSDAQLQGNYVFRWAPQTYVLPDLICVGLAQLLPLFVVGRIYVGVAIVGLAASTWFLSRSLVGRPSIWVLAVGFLVYNHVLEWGFISFLWGISLTLTTFGLWIRKDGRLTSRSLLLFAALTLATYLTHVVAVAVLGVLIASHQLQAILEKRSNAFVALFQIGCLFVPPALLSIFKDVGEAVRSGPTVYGDISTKLTALLSPVLTTGHPIEFAIALFLFISVYLLRKTLLPTSAARLPLLAITILAVLMPTRLLGVFGMDFRLPLVVCLLWVASVQHRPMSVSAKRVLLGLGCVLLLARSFTIGITWNQRNAELAELRSALSSIPRGAKVLSVGYAEPRNYHVNSLAAIDRSAFVPTLFTGATVLRPSAVTKPLDTASGIPLPIESLMNPAEFSESGYHRNYWSNWRRDFDYVIAFGQNPQPTDGCQTVCAGSFFQILSITRGSVE